MNYPNDYINKIIWGDCLKVMKYIPDKSIDLVFYDPPYNAKKKYKNYNDNLPPEIYKQFMIDVYKEANRISKRGVIIYVGGTLTKLLYSILDNAHLIIIHKRAAGVFAGNYMLQYHSMFSTAKPIIKCKDLWDDVRLPGEGYFFREERYDSPGMTSRLLIEKVLYHFSLETEVILDPFMGCGATAHACKNTNRKFIGIDMSKEYCDIAKKRINEEN